MARRRKLEAPDPKELEKFGAAFRRDSGPPTAPIGVLAADSAAAADLRDEAARAEAARIRARAEAFDDAEGRGLVLSEVPTQLIDETVLVRDRSILADADMYELQDSIHRTGLRLPIEIFELPEPREGKVYGLLSGYRRLLAVRELERLGHGTRYGAIRAILRDPEAMGGRFLAMVEENEIRASLSHFERGRIAVIAAKQGAYPNVEAAVEDLFTAASKAKRSKVRSFALIFEELGDLMRFPEEMTERQGLRVAAALRAGRENDLRRALSLTRAESQAEEWEILEPVVAEAEAQVQPARGARGGRPRSRPAAASGDGETRVLTNGIKITTRHGEGKMQVAIEGGIQLDRAIQDSVVMHLAYLLDKG